MISEPSEHSTIVLQQREPLARRNCLTLWGVVAFFSLCLSICLVERLERNLWVARDGVLQRGGDDSTSTRKPETKGGAQRYQRIEEKNGHLTAEYGFVNFNNHPLRVSFSVTAHELAAYKQGYGYTASELAAIGQWQQKALEEAYQSAVKNRLGQAELNRMSEAISAEYKSKYRAFLVSRGFALQQGKIVVADVPAIARRNAGNLRPVAQQVGRNAEGHQYDSDETIAAALSLVQTAIRYDKVPMQINGKQTGGIYPPLETIVKGGGDCDTKAALLGSILLNWSKMKLIGISLPNHYVMGVLRNPARGDAFVEYQGLRYVLMEPAGPAWLAPGTVGPSTLALLNSGQSLIIEPFNAN